MDRMDSIIGSQWMDFSEGTSPQMPMKDYFEKEHAIHGRIVEFCDVPTSSVSHINKEAQQDLDIIKNIPVKIISPKYSKKPTTEEITCDQVFTDAVKKLVPCKKPLKAQDGLDKTIQGTDIFKTPNIKIIKSSRSVGYCSVPNKSIQSSITRRSVRPGKDACTPKSSDEVIVHKTKALTSSALKQDRAGANNVIFKETDIIEMNDHENEEEVNDKHTEEHEERNEEGDKATLHKSEELMSDKKEEQNDTMDTVIKKYGRTQSHKQRASVLTWQNGRRSLNNRRGSNRFVSLAEAVSRFQNDTPKRFRTKCDKEPAAIIKNLSSKALIQHHRLKTTIPISPALMSKNRTRAITVLSQEEREKREMEELKKNPIKANPVPTNVLRGPVFPVRPVLKVAAKKPTAIATNSSSSASVSQQLEKKPSMRRTSTPKNALLKPKNPEKSHRDKVSAKNTVTKVLVHDPNGIIVEKEEIPYFGVHKDSDTPRSVTRVMPFSFEARNKNLQMMKEERLKSLHEASKAKMEFHARPVPNFSKPPLTTPPPTAKQLKEKRKTIVQQCPFSFEDRDKNWSKKREELAKRMLDEEKRMRLFRANPVPVFKPVMVRGVSKERLPTSQRAVKAVKEHAVKDNNQENEEPNIVSTEKAQGKKDTREIKKIAVGKQQNAKGKGRENNLIKATLPLELNTDKRARERREFDERIKRKEMEEEAARQEEKRRQEENEKQTIAEQRKLMEVKAQPIPTYKPLIIIKATKPLTEPRSPALGNKHKSK